VGCSIDRRRVRLRQALLGLLVVEIVGACAASHEAPDHATPRAASEATAAEPAAALIGQPWRLVQIMSMDDSVYRPSSPSAYVLEFDADRTIHVRADCNRGRGEWTLKPPSGLEIGALAMTRMHCGPESLHDRFLTDLDYVRSFVLRDGHLFLATMADGAILELEPMDDAPEPAR